MFYGFHIDIPELKSEDISMNKDVSFAYAFTEKSCLVLTIQRRCLRNKGLFLQPRSRFPAFALQ